MRHIDSKVKILPMRSEFLPPLVDLCMGADGLFILNSDFVENLPDGPCILSEHPSCIFVSPFLYHSLDNLDLIVRKVRQRYPDMLVTNPRYSYRSMVHCYLTVKSAYLFPLFVDLPFLKPSGHDCQRFYLPTSNSPYDRKAVTIYTARFYTLPMSQTETAKRKTRMSCIEVPDEDSELLPAKVEVDKLLGYVVTFEDGWKVAIDRGDLYADQLTITVKGPNHRSVFDTTVWARA
jgi:hypothetical protein